MHATCKQYDYEVPRMILLQAYLYTYILQGGVIFAVLPLSYALSVTFLELLLWNSFQCHRHIFFGCLQYPEPSSGGIMWVFHISNGLFLARNFLTESALLAGALS
jgi:hypothetical protein